MTADPWDKKVVTFHPPLRSAAQCPAPPLPAGHIGHAAPADRAAVLFGVATLMLQDAQNALRMIAEGRTPDGAAHRMSELQDVAKVALDRVSMSVLVAMAIDIEALRR